MHDLPKYKGLKRRCDSCDREFRVRDMVAASEIEIAGFLRSYTLIFCYKGGDIKDQKCLLSWRVKYEALPESGLDFTVMVYYGKNRPGGEHTENLAYI